MAIQTSWTEASMRAHAILGVAWLQKHYPMVFPHIDLDVLDMDNGNKCALGLCHGAGEGPGNAYFAAVGSHCLAPA